MTLPAVVDANARTNRFLRKLAIMVGILFLLLNAVTAGSVLRIALRSVDQSAYNARLIEIILAVTGCSSFDTPEECADKVTNKAHVEGSRRIVEVDCAARRLAAGMPAPDPTKPCPEQTPSIVYPGTP